MGFIEKKVKGWLWVLMSCEGTYTETPSACAFLLAISTAVVLCFWLRNSTKREKEEQKEKEKSSNGVWHIIH